MTFFSRVSESVFHSWKAVKHDCTVKYTDSDRCIIRIMARTILYSFCHLFGVSPCEGFFLS